MLHNNLFEFLWLNCRINIDLSWYFIKWNIFCLFLLISYTIVSFIYMCIYFCFFSFKTANCYYWYFSSDIYDNRTDGKQRFKCTVCLYSTNVKCNLQRHVRIHSGERPFHCNVCNKGFIQKHDLKLHLFQHTDERPYQCNICFKGFVQERYLKIHVYQHRKDGEV